MIEAICRTISSTFPKRMTPNSDPLTPSRMNGSKWMFVRKENCITHTSASVCLPCVQHAFIVADVIDTLIRHLRMQIVESCCFVQFGLWRCVATVPSSSVPRASGLCSVSILYIAYGYSLCMQSFCICLAPRRCLNSSIFQTSLPCTISRCTLRCAHICGPGLVFLSLEIDSFSHSCASMGSMSGHVTFPENRQSWVPVFDKYHMTLGLEHHIHTFKRTHKLRNQEVVSDPDAPGTIYLGDGNLGIATSRTPEFPESDEKFFAVVGPQKLCGLFISV